MTSNNIHVKTFSMRAVWQTNRNENYFFANQNVNIMLFMLMRMLMMLSAKFKSIFVSPFHGRSVSLISILLYLKRGMCSQVFHLRRHLMWCAIKTVTNERRKDDVSPTRCIYMHYAYSVLHTTAFSRHRMRCIMYALHC